MFTCLSRKRGRPLKFQPINSALIIKKENLFNGSINSKSQYMSLMHIAYHSNKITQEEFETAILLENIYYIMKKELGVKSIPKISPSAWSSKLKVSYINSTKNSEKALLEWNNIKTHIQKHEPQIAQDFLNLICSHHSYEELIALKLNTKIMNILKRGLECINNYF